MLIMRFKRISYMLLGAVFMLLFIAPSYATAETLETFFKPEQVLYREITAEGQQNWNMIPQYWTSGQQTCMKEFLSNSFNKAHHNGICNIESAKFVEIKELSLEKARLFTDLDQYTNQYKDVKVFYLGVDYKVNQENMYYYNGVNYFLPILIKENNQWLIAEMPQAPVANLVSIGLGFNSPAEKIASRISEARNKGIFINADGKVLANIAATPAQLHEEQEQLSKEGNNLPEDMSQRIVPSNDHVVPGSINVYLTDSTNYQYYGYSNPITKSISFSYYIKNVLPKEWYPSDPTHALVAGAIAVKMYGWYYAYYPKWSQYGASVKDNTQDQVFLVNSEQSSTTSAINFWGSTGIDTWNRTLFVTHYLQGQSGPGNQASGYMWQLGSSYWANQGKDWGYILEYYYDYSPATNYDKFRIFQY